MGVFKKRKKSKQHSMVTVDHIEHLMGNAVGDDWYDSWLEMSGEEPIKKEAEPEPMEEPANTPEEPVVNIVNSVTKEKFRLYEKRSTPYAILEIQAGRLTTNVNVRWLLTEFSRLYRPLDRRISLQGGKVVYTPEMTVWWEVFLHKGQIKFYLVVPDIDTVKYSLTRQVMKTWKNANVKEVKEYLPELDSSKTDITQLKLARHSVLALDSQNSNYTPLDTFMNAKHHLKDDDIGLLQIGMLPAGNGWNENAREVLEKIRETSKVPRKKGEKLTAKEFAIKVGLGLGIVAEHLMNLLGDFWIPGWEEDTDLSDSMKDQYGSVDSPSTSKKVRDDAFRCNINVVAMSDDLERRRSIIRALSSGFDPLEGDNRLVEKPVREKDKQKVLTRVADRQIKVSITSTKDDVFCAGELSRMLHVPDSRIQTEHQNDIKVVQHRSEAAVPREVFVNNGIPFAQYEDNDGTFKTIYFNAVNFDLLCKARVIIGEPGSGKTTFAVSYALDAFNMDVQHLKTMMQGGDKLDWSKWDGGFGSLVIDAADGKLVQNILNSIRPDQRDKVKIIDFLDEEYAVGLGWNEAFLAKNEDIIEDMLVDEIITYIELVSENELNMTAKQWVENAVKAVFTSPDATLQDVENMINNADYRLRVIPKISDPELRADWEYYHEKMKPEERKAIYDQIYRRMASLIRKKTLKKFILQKPKKDENGEYVVNLRKWMDEGYLVLVRANETLGETLQTALVSFLIAKFNLAMVSREDIVNENERRPCFLILDEPDHYIRGSERWRNMLTRFRKYRCGLIPMFHGWQQLIEQDRNLPKIIRKAGPHYVIFQTDEDNLLELQPIIEPEYKVKDIAKGMPLYHALLKIHTGGESVSPTFMSKAIDMAKNRYEQYDNNDLYKISAHELGRPKNDVLEEIYRAKGGQEFDLSIEVAADGEGDLLDMDVDAEQQVVEDDPETKARVKRKLEYMVGNFIEEQISKGEDPDEEMIIEMDRLLAGGTA